MNFNKQIAHITDLGRNNLIPGPRWQDNIKMGTRNMLEGLCQINVARNVLMKLLFHVR